MLACLKMRRAAEVRANGLPTFLSALCRNPARVGAVAPCSNALARTIAARVDPGSRAVLEVGSGTGSVTRALLERGIAAHRLYAIELDPYMAEYLDREFPGVRVICGDASRLPDFLPAGLFGKVSVAVSSLPLLNMHPLLRSATVGSVINSLAPDGVFLQYTYGLNCPLARTGLQLKSERVDRIWNNLPPASVWRYQRSNTFS